MPMHAWDVADYPDMVSIDIGPHAKESLTALFKDYDIDRDMRKMIYSNLVDIVLIGDEAEKIISLSDDILNNVYPVGGIALDDILIVTNHLRRIYDATKSTFDSLGIMIYGIPPYEFLDYFDYRNIILRKAKNIDHSVAWC